MAMRLILKNVGIIKSADILLDGLTIIAGNNDTGKSTVGKIAYALTKAFEDFETNYKKLKNQLFERQFRNFYTLLRKDLDLKESAELRKIISRFLLYRRIDNKSRLESAREISRYLEKNKTRLGPEIKEKIDTIIKEMEGLYRKKDSTKAKILSSINSIFSSEFKGQIRNISSENAKITVLEGNNTIIELSIKNGSIRSSKEIDEIFPFESSVFIETPFVLTYKEALEDITYHVEDLINKLETPFIKPDNKALDIKKVIGGELAYDEDEDTFLFRKYIKGKLRKIDILNSASGIKNIGILQILDKTGEFDKNTLLIIDEPEVHLHPDWQVEYARILVCLVREGVKVLITSHSPYLIEAINKFAKKEKIENTRFYLSELEDDGMSTITDKTKDKEEIFDKLSKPFERLVFGD